MRYFKNGGLHFLRVGRLQLSFCVCRARRAQARESLSSGAPLAFSPNLSSTTSPRPWPPILDLNLDVTKQLAALAAAQL